MAELWLASDHHLGHKNIINYEKINRDFSDVESHDEEIVYRHNQCVRKEDKVIFVGDLAFSLDSMLHNVPRMNGYITLVMGNHDTFTPTQYMQAGIVSLRGAIKYKDRKRKVSSMITHIPIHAEDFKDRVDFNIHGHLHSKRVKEARSFTRSTEIDHPNYFNVSLEQNNLAPINYNEAIKTMMERIQ